jgi:origin recognition complex subunit 2
MPRRKELGALASKRRAVDGADDNQSRSKRRRVPSQKLREVAEDEEAYVRSTLDLNGTSNKKHSGRRLEVVEVGDSEEHDEEDVETPKKRGRPPKSAKTTVTTPSRRGRGNKETPSKANGTNGITPRRRRAADRSAKKKSARALIQSVVEDDGSEGEDNLARAIYELDSSSGEEDSESDEEENAPTSVVTAPSKSATTTRRKVGRPRKQKSPTPPGDLPPHEHYFFHNRPGRVRTSDNTLSQLDLLTHEEYFSLARSREDPHAEALDFLESLHEGCFPQWDFEMSQGFTVVLYGLGSKRKLLQNFASFAAKRRPKTKIVIVNGHVRTVTPRDIFATVLLALDPTSKPGTQPSSMLSAIDASLSANPNAKPTLLISSIDAPPLRKPTIQTLFAQLASRASILCTADTPDFPLMWDASLRSALNPAFHDATTLQPLETELDVVDDVHELLGRSARRAGGREAVSFVLKSLTRNARSLYGLLVSEVLVAMDDEWAGGENPGIEYRMLYSKAVEAFVCPSSEMAFRQLLRE